MNTHAKQQLFEQIAAIQAMERGKLSPYSFKERSGRKGPYYKLQSWQNGKNVTRYVSAEELPDIQAALDGYAQYQKLTQEYAEMVISETRQSIAAAKKKTSPSTSSWRRTRKSSN